LVNLAEALERVPSTFFVTADAADAFSAELHLVAAKGHEIGCHGLDHSPLDDYAALSMEDAQLRLQEAARRITSSTGSPVRSFRGPRMTTSAGTQSLLRMIGFSSDFSVCSHRGDFLCASRYRIEWFGLKPRPYAPAPGSAFTPQHPGQDSSLLVVPLSGFGLPFLSGSLYVLGKSFFKRFASFLTWHARRSGAPIVYLLHSYEFAELSGGDSRRPWHHRLYGMRPLERYTANLDLISFLTGPCRLVPQTASAFVDGYWRTQGGGKQSA
jgi:hypothetical protein